MTKKLYKLMDWARIEGVVYSEEDNPHSFLGINKVLGGYLFQAFLPFAKKAKVVVKTGNDAKEYPMELADEEGFFAACVTKLAGIDKVSYFYKVEDKDGNVIELEDPYRFKPTISDEILSKFNAGICYDVYKYLGSHVKTIDGVRGVSFSVWAPNAVRVSVVGDFNGWDGRIHQMRRLSDSGVFEIFIPGVSEGATYKYELKFKGSVIALKSDPYCMSAELRPNTASVVVKDKDFDFTDKEWMKNRKAIKADKPMAIYEIDFSSFGSDDESKFPNYIEIANELCDYVKETGYTHIEVLPVMEYPLDESLGFQTIGYFAPTKRYGEPSDFKYFINHFHENGIGVILDWNPASFPKDDHGLSYFDGTCLYEHQDKRQGLSADGNMCLYNYGRPEVSNYLISNALFWIKEYHADGIKINDVAKMIYLDYGKSEGNYVANIYGGNENLESLELLKHLNSINDIMKTGAMIITDGYCDYPMLTEKLNKNGVGFSYKWNKNFIKDLTEFMYFDPIYRAAHYDELTLSMVYAYSENYILALSQDEALDANGSVLNKLPGSDEKKRANLKLMMGYLFTHPGKKLIYKDHKIKDGEKELIVFIKDLLSLYKETKELYELDEKTEGFEWINNISAKENIITFLRKSKDNEQVLVVCNFADYAYEKYTIGVPFAGKYKEIFNSDAEKYGGSGLVNKRVKNSKEVECDFKNNSITVNIAPLSISIFKCTKAWWKGVFIASNVLVW